MIVRPDDLAFKAQLADEIHGPRLHGKETIGTGFDDAVPNILGLHHAPQARARFDQRTGNAGFREIVSGGEPGDATADDGY